jgi:hypothetical protein
MTKTFGELHCAAGAFADQLDVYAAMVSVV